MHILSNILILMIAIGGMAAMLLIVGAPVEMIHRCIFLRREKRVKDLLSKPDWKRF